MLPFDYKYLPDCILTSEDPMCMENATNYGKENIIVKDVLGFYAKETWIIDNRCIQFGYDDKKVPIMYIFHLTNKKVDKINLETIDANDAKWLFNCSLFSKEIRKKEDSESIKNDPLFQIVASSLICAIHYLDFPMNDKAQEIEYNFCIDKLKNTFGINYEHNIWYLPNGDETTWGRVATGLLKSYQIV